MRVKRSHMGRRVLKGEEIRDEKVGGGFKGEGGYQRGGVNGGGGLREGHLILELI